MEVGREAGRVAARVRCTSGGSAGRGGGGRACWSKSKCRMDGGRGMADSSLDLAGREAAAACVGASPNAGWTAAAVASWQLHGNSSETCLENKKGEMVVSDAKSRTFFFFTSYDSQNLKIGDRFPCSQQVSIPKGERGRDGSHEG